ncbi:hypothetical protein GCM10023189_24730 [Nibrella saemangeumensis]|uniref:Phosphoribosylformylglycinamidine synthase n=1 Tax=Nibrella saemangeumensis TaxID=1084526 RepID=A0ABP8MU06_9BACT
MKKFVLLFFLVAGSSIQVFSQVSADSLKVTNEELDSRYIYEVEDRKEPDKVLHAEPLYVDLIRDLGARKGEREWNIGLGLIDNLRFDTYQALIEYEFAPINRVGFEVEIPITLYTLNEPNQSRPSDRIESLKTAIQWSFLVSERMKTTLALGYINELKFTDLARLRAEPVLMGNEFNPFFVAAKRWGNNFHTLVYTGPRFERLFGRREWHRSYEINTNFHLMIPGTRNFLGIEFNKNIAHNKVNGVARPQLRLGVSDNLLIGIVAGIPFSRQDQRLSSFLRIIYEPAHKNRKPVFVG